jgi:hypothetical protein
MDLGWEPPRTYKVFMVAACRLLKEMIDDGRLPVPSKYRDFNVGTLRVEEQKAETKTDWGCELDPSGAVVVFIQLRQQGPHRMEFRRHDDHTSKIDVEMPCTASVCCLDGDLLDNYESRSVSSFGKITMGVGLFPMVEHEIDDDQDFTTTASTSSSSSSTSSSSSSSSDQQVDVPKSPPPAVDVFTTPSKRTRAAQAKREHEVFALKSHPSDASTTATESDQETEDQKAETVADEDAEAKFAAEWAQAAMGCQEYLGTVHDNLVPQDDGSYDVDLQRVQRAMLADRPRLTQVMLEAVTTQQEAHGDKYWGKASVSESKRVDRKRLEAMVRTAIPLSFDKDGKNIVAGRGTMGDAALGIESGDVILVPAAMGRARLEAVEASLSAYVYNKDEHLPWSPEKAYDGYLAKMHCSLDGLTEDFPQYYAPGETPAGKEEYKVKRFAPGIAEVAWKLVDLILGLHNPKGGKRRAARSKKLAQQMAHPTLCWYNGCVPPHMDAPHFDGPKHYIINFMCKGTGMYLLKYMRKDKVVARAVWLMEGDMLQLHGSFRYEWLHMVMRVYEGDDPSKWMPKLSDSTIRNARSIISMRLATCPEDRLQDYYTVLQEGPDCDLSTIPDKYIHTHHPYAAGGVAASPRKRPSITPTAKPSATGAVPGDKAVDAVLSSRAWNDTQILATCGQFTVVEQLKHRRLEYPVFMAGMVFSLRVYARMSTKGKLRIHDNTKSTIKVRVHAVAQLKLSSSKPNVIVVTVQEETSKAWEGPYNVVATAMPLLHLYTMEAPFFPDPAVVAAHIQELHPNPPLAIANRLGAAVQPANEDEDQGLDDGSGSEDLGAPDASTKRRRMGDRQSARSLPVFAQHPDDSKARRGLYLAQTPFDNPVYTTTTTTTTTSATSVRPARDYMDGDRDTKAEVRAAKEQQRADAAIQALVADSRAQEIAYNEERREARTAAATVAEKQAESAQATVIALTAALAKKDQAAPNNHYHASTALYGGRDSGFYGPPAGDLRLADDLYERQRSLLYNQTSFAQPRQRRRSASPDRNNGRLGYARERDGARGSYDDRYEERGRFAGDPRGERGGGDGGERYDDRGGYEGWSGPVHRGGGREGAAEWDRDRYSGRERYWGRDRQDYNRQHHQPRPQLMHADNATPIPAIGLSSHGPHQLAYDQQPRRQPQPQDELEPASASPQPSRNQPAVPDDAIHHQRLQYEDDPNLGQPLPPSPAFNEYRYQMQRSRRGGYNGGNIDRLEREAYDRMQARRDASPPRSQRY